MNRFNENWPKLQRAMNDIHSFDLHLIIRFLTKTSKKSSAYWTRNSCRNRAAASHADRPVRLDRLLQQLSVGPEEQVANSWSLVHKSPYFDISDEGLVGRRRSVSQTTDCLRGRISYSVGLHVWTIKWPITSRGTHAMVGVGTKMAPLSSTGYFSLLGSNAESWGWDLVRNKCCYNGCEQMYPNWLSPNTTVLVPDQFQVVLDMDAGTLGFIVNQIYLGVAFSGLKGKKLFPMISTVWGNGKIEIKYESTLDPNPLSLEESCRQVIRASVGKQRIYRIKSELDLPNKLIHYIMH